MDTVEDLRQTRVRITLRDNQSLSVMLAAVATQGWDSAPGRDLLAFVREEVVRPTAIGLGLRGSAAGDGEATGWVAAWRTLCDPGLLDADRPWAVLWAAVRRAMLGEVLARRYATYPRQAWRIDEAVGRSVYAPRVEPVGVAVSAPLPDHGPENARARLAAILDPIVASLATVGWDTHVVAAIIDDIVRGVPRSGETASLSDGWRPLAEHLGVEPWRVRRLCVALVGTPQWPGLIERVGRQGPRALRAPEARAALASTVRRSRRSPALEAIRQAARADSGARMRTPGGHRDAA